MNNTKQQIQHLNKKIQKLEQNIKKYPKDKNIKRILQITLGKKKKKEKYLLKINKKNK